MPVTITACGTTVPLPPDGGVTPLPVPGLEPAGGVTPELVGVLELGTLAFGGVTLLAFPGNPVIGLEFGAVMLLAVLMLEMAGATIEVGV